ncbi:preprotein translocase subunit SecA [Chloroflexota bacterium]
MFKFLDRLIDSNEKELKRLKPLVEQINLLEPKFERLTNIELRAKTNEFKSRLKAGSSLDELLPEAFTVVREAAKRTIGQRHFDVQLMGGIVLHQGKIAEMKTGEGKTLVATLSLYLNSLTSQGCHLVTVNDYLAKRDHRWMGPIYFALGVSTASIQHESSFIYDPSYSSEDNKWDYLRPISRKEAYEAEITYGTNNEFGFDYLRDNMVLDLSQCVQRPPNYAIVDEVDNILVDEARTPLIISGMREEATKEYETLARIVRQLKKDNDYKMSEKGKGVDEITDAGYENTERLLRREGALASGSLYDSTNAGLLHRLRNAITAKEAYQRDREYMIKDGQIVIVDEFTGRLMLGRRYSEGLHQAIEAKEGVKVQRESMTFATVTFQNYFRMYHNLAGMTGTAATEAEEFYKIYKLDVVVIPTHKPMIREDFSDRIYKNERGKLQAVVDEIEESFKQGRPVLIGTVSIEKSEILSDMLKRRGIPHQVLNAKYHEKEASIIAQAGRLSAVTVATNMAGRGVDIILGGIPTGRDEKDWQQEHEEVVKLGGLHIIGTERHEARRIDNQLRGRAGRQGDLGSSRFYISLEDDIVRRFGGDRIKSIMEWAGLDETTPIENRLVNRTIENSQIRVEGYNFDTRKHLIEYDDVVNKHRELIYGERRKILTGADLKANILGMVKEEVEEIIASYTKDEHDNDWDTKGLINDILAIFPLPRESNIDTFSSLKSGKIVQRLITEAKALYEQREKEMGSENMRMLERLVMLRVMDNLWIEHLTAMEHLRLDAGWQSLRQIQPVDAYKNAGYKLFQDLLAFIRHEVARTIYHVSINRRETPPHPSPMSQVVTNQISQKQPVKANSKKIGRNDPCPCGNGKKYKHCCGR